MIDFNIQTPKILNEFLMYILSVKNMSLATVKEYGSDIKRFLVFLKDRQYCLTEKNFDGVDIKDISSEFLDSISSTDIEHYIHFLINVRKVSICTKNRQIASINKFFNYLKDNKLITVNPIIQTYHTRTQHKLPKILSLEDSQKLLLTAYTKKAKRNKIRDYTIITLFLNLGIRLEELVSLNLSDIDLNNKSIKILGKGNKERVLYLNNSCISVLKEYLNVRSTQMPNIYSQNALFLSERLQRISRRSVQYLVKEEFKNAGIDVNKYSVHKLRHTAATLMFQNGVDIRAIQKILGHEELATTQIYTHVSNMQTKKALEINKVNSILEKGDFIG